MASIVSPLAHAAGEGGRGRARPESAPSHRNIIQDMLSCGNPNRTNAMPTTRSPGSTPPAATVPVPGAPSRKRAGHAPTATRCAMRRHFTKFTIEKARMARDLP